MTWARLTDHVPPDDGTPFEVRVDCMPDVRLIFSWRRTDKPPLFVLGVSPQESNADQWVDPPPDEVGFRPGWWRALPSDDPPTMSEAEGGRHD